MKKFKQYLIESNTSSATNMELAIVQVNNNETLKHPDYKDSATNIVKFLNNNGISGKGKHMGSGSFQLSSFWKEHGGTNSTPKTDLIIDKSKISLKKEGGSQLMSGMVGESRATFYAALKLSNMSSIKMVNEVEGYLSKFVLGKDPLNITQQKKYGTVKQEVLDADNMHKQFTTYLTQTFNSNKLFRDSFIYEAMSGYTKFNNSEGTASHILVFDAINGINNKLHSVNDKSYISSKASKTKVNISWKSTSSTTKKSGKMYNFFSVIRLINGKVNEEIEKYEGVELNEGILSNIKDKVMSFFKSLWLKIKTWLSKSVENVLTFFSVEPIIKVGSINY